MEKGFQVKPWVWQGNLLSRPTAVERRPLISKSLLNQPLLDWPWPTWMDQINQVGSMRSFLPRSADKVRTNPETTWNASVLNPVKILIPLSAGFISLSLYKHLPSLWSFTNHKLYQKHKRKNQDQASISSNHEFDLQQLWRFICRILGAESEGLLSFCNTEG